MHSPVKQQVKKMRKNTFSQVAVTQSEVGEFQGGYFVMPDATSSKENDCPYPSATKSRPPPSPMKAERSPGRRKQPHQTHTSESSATTTTIATSSPRKERSSSLLKVDDTCKKPFAEVKKENSKTEMLLLPPGSFLASPSKTVPASPKQMHMELDQKYPKDLLSASPPTSGRWAGPAFGNAPHPSSLPLPEFPPMMTTTPIQAVSTPSPYPMVSQDAYLSKSPPAPDSAILGMVYHPSSSFPPVLPSSSPPTSHLSSIPVVPFPYVGGPILQFSPIPSPAPAPSLAQLSTDLRRILNINGPPSVPVVVSANSC